MSMGESADGENGVIGVDIADSAENPRDSETTEDGERCRLSEKTLKCYVWLQVR